MSGAREFSSENARNVILRHQDKLYYVSRVSVASGDGKTKHRAVFHTRRVVDSQAEDLDLEISRKLYDVLVGYTRLDNSDQILILQIDEKDSKWCLISENWFRQCTNGAHGSSHDKYVI